MDFRQRGKKRHMWNIQAISLTLSPFEISLDTFLFDSIKENKHSIKDSHLNAILVSEPHANFTQKFLFL